ncbi:MAG: methyltransferase domain-containing protein, partial [Candidatus Falkowbacteria bacterium]|nr:methyltransferase domain-containing protein [Candidatus Falkowbacteria bacterium]
KKILKTIMIKKIQHIFYRRFLSSDYFLGNIRRIKPISSKFGLDRGTPIDRYYIEKFLNNNSSYIHGDVLEIANSDYSQKFGKDVNKFEVLHYDNSNPKATVIGDLTKLEDLPENFVDCFICTQTFNFIYDLRLAIQGARHLLKRNGVLLATVAGISQISRYDMDRWGDYWRFTTLSIKKIFEEEFGSGNVDIDFYGNCLAACSFLNGLSVEELTQQELDFKDENYQVLITITAIKNNDY